MFYETAGEGHGLRLDPFKAIVAPRPIGWISSRSATGSANLAPYSYFNAVADDPYYVVFGSGGYKHSLSNVAATGEFCVNFVTAELAEAMNATSAQVGPEVDEFDLAGLEKAPCRLIGAARVRKSPVALECRHFRTLELPDDAGRVNDWLVVARVLGVHIDDAFISDGRVNTAAMRLVARLGYSEYSTVTDAFRMRRPD